MKFNKVNLMLLVLVFISLVSTGILLANRIETERQSKTVDMMISFVDLEELSEQSDDNIDVWLEKFKEIGATSVSLSEITLNSMINDSININTKMIDQLNDDLAWRLEYSEEAIEYLQLEKIDKYDVIVEVANKTEFEFLKNRLYDIYPDEFYMVFPSDNLNIIILDGTIKDVYFKEENVLANFEEKNIRREVIISSSKLFDIGLGYDEDKILLIQKADLEVNLRPKNYSRFAEEKLNYYKDYVIDKDLIPSYFVFDGEVLGFPDSQKIYEFMKDNNIYPVLIESSNQRSNLEQYGIAKLVENFDFEAIRLFSTFNYIQKRYNYLNYDGAEEIGNTFYRAITERNIRIIYFRPFKENESMYVTDMDEYEKVFKNLEERLVEHGIIYGIAEPFQNNAPNLIYLILSGVGIIAVGIYLIKDFLNIKSKYLLIVLILGIFLMTLMLVVAPNLGVAVLALTASLVFSSIGIYYFVKIIHKIILEKNEEISDLKIIINSGKFLFLTVGISLIGGVVIASLLSHTKYLLEVEFYRGVKISELTPLLIFIVLYILKMGYDRKIYNNMDKLYFKDLLKVLDLSIKVKHIVVAGVIGIIGYVYIARTGHETSIGISDYELIVRNFLEINLLARPRTKEFLMAFPAIMLAINFAYLRIKAVFPVAVLGAIGYTSVLNTFSHLRTPIYLSVYRTITSTIFGFVLGAIGILVLNFLIRQYNRVKHG